MKPASHPTVRQDGRAQVRRPGLGACPCCASALLLCPLLCFRICESQPQTWICKKNHASLFSLSRIELARLSPCHIRVAGKCSLSVPPLCIPRSRSVGGDLSSPQPTLVTAEKVAWLKPRRCFKCRVSVGQRMGIPGRFRNPSVERPLPLQTLGLGTCWGNEDAPIYFPSWRKELSPSPFSLSDIQRNVFDELQKARKNCPLSSSFRSPFFRHPDEVIQMAWLPAW